jgi:hypothetical protein
MMRPSVGLASVVLLAAVGCGDDDADVRADDDPAEVPVTTEPSDSGPVRGSLIVLEDTEHGPQLCSVVEDSYPPQCGGPDVVGWSWDDVADEESANGTTWGSYEVTGTWDGQRLTLTEAPGPPRPTDLAEKDFSSPCPEPAGGWTIVDPAHTTQQSRDAVLAAAQSRPQFAGAWVDHSTNPAADEPVEGIEGELAMDDPAEQILNVRVTGDLDGAEADLREVWGGALCVSSADHTMAELRSIQEEITADGLLGPGSAVDEVENVVDLWVFVDGGLQAELDERYGPGTVVVEPTLVPVD